MRNGISVISTCILGLEKVDRTEKPYLIWHTGFIA